MGALEEHEAIQLTLSRRYQSKRKVMPDKVSVIVNDKNQLGQGDTYENVADWVKEASLFTGLNQPSARVEWEFPILAKREPVGYLDLLVTRMEYHLRFIHEGHEVTYGSICDEASHWNYYVEEIPTDRLAIEVKSHINSLGELIRQVNKYRAALPWCDCPYRYGEKICISSARSRWPSLPGHYLPKFVVVSPDDRFQGELISQDIWFRKCGPGGELED